jgi:hypothetical protein
MKNRIRVALLCSAAALAFGQSSDAANANKAAKGDKPVHADGAAAQGLAAPGKVLFEDTFGRAEMAPKWRVGKGYFTVKDGVVTVAENPDDKHGAYAYVTPAFPYKNVVAEFSVKMDGARSCNLMINDSKYKESHAGHILKATVAPGKVNVADWKFGAMKNDVYEKLKDEKTPAEEKKKLREGIKDKSADFKVAADLTQWHAVRVEIVNDEMLVSLDGQPAAYLRSEGVDHPTKNAIGFEVGGKAVEIKDVKVYEATAAGDWPSRRKAVVASLGK